MYGYGYHYPRVPRKVEAVYTDPDYRYKWFRAATMNRSVAANSPWIAFLRQRGSLQKIADELRSAGAQYRALYGVKLKYKTAATKRKTKIENAIKAIEDEKIKERLRTEFGDNLKEPYIADTIKTLQKELAHLQMLID
jgi:hypothetical protein